MTVKLGKLTVFDWIDSCSAAGGGAWKDADSVRDMTAIECRSVGWILREDKKSVVIASQVTQIQVGGDMCIPKSAIFRRQVLSEPRKRK